MSLRHLFLLIALFLNSVLSQTPTNVTSDGTDSENVTESGIAGATITAGMPVYVDAGDNDELKPCQATTEAAATCVGIALNGASTGQPLFYQTVGIINLGATLDEGDIYVVDDGTAGVIAFPSELDAGDYVKVLAIAISATEAKLLVTHTPVVQK